MALTPEQIAEMNNQQEAGPSPEVKEETQTAVAFGEQKRIIVGLQNLTNHAGSTTLVNMMVRQLNNHGISSIGIEMFRQDLLFYHSPVLFSCMNKFDVEALINKNTETKGIIIDLNDFGEASEICDEVIYLVEPSYVMLTRLLKKNKNAFEEMHDKNIILNKSFVNEQELDDFEFESKCKVFMDLPCLNDRNENISEINDLLIKLGFNVNNDGE